MVESRLALHRPVTPDLFRGPPGRQRWLANSMRSTGWPWMPEQVRHDDESGAVRL